MKRGDTNVNSALIVLIGMMLHAPAVIAEHGGRDRTDRVIEARDDKARAERSTQNDAKEHHNDSGLRKQGKSGEAAARSLGDAKNEVGISSVAAAVGTPADSETDEEVDASITVSVDSSGSNQSSSNSGSEDNSGSDELEGIEDHDRVASSVSGDESDDDAIDDSGEDSDDDAEDDSRGMNDMDVLARASSVRLAIEVDSEGRQRRASEVIMIGSDAEVRAVQAAGYVLIDVQLLCAFNETLARIRVNEGESVEAAVTVISALAPAAQVAPNHVFQPSQGQGVTAAAALPTNTLPTTRPAAVRLGIVDTGVDETWSVLRHQVIAHRGFAGSGYTPREHGTVVAGIAASAGAPLIVADVFGVDADNRLIAPAEAITRAIDWLLADGVKLINISIEGPDNPVLAYVIRRAVAQGALIVAAAGNSGPAAPPAYPAAYPGVIAVTAVDDQGRVYPRANRGRYISFAARGVRINTGYGKLAAGTVTGTSFAAPQVSAELARRLEQASDEASAVLIERLQREARDLGAPGRDVVFGWGLLDSMSAAEGASSDGRR
jgi:minor extracellular protease Epr